MKNNDKIFNYKGKLYPEYIKHGNACHFIESVAKKFCIGKGLDIGGTKDWNYPKAQIINIEDPSNDYDAYNLPNKKYDYIFSSHTLEHLPNYVQALEYWIDHLKKGGVLFLYLPHPDMEYWLPQNNKKHLSVFYPNDINKCLKDLGMKQVINSERDMYWAFTVVGIK